MSRILIVEDTPLMRESLVDVLTATGHEVTTADNGLDAVEMIAGGAAFDAIITDIIMPEMDGIQAIMEIQTLQHHRHIRRQRAHAEGAGTGNRPPPGRGGRAGKAVRGGYPAVRRGRGAGVRACIGDRGRSPRPLGGGRVSPKHLPPAA